MSDQDKETPIEPEETESVEMNDEPKADRDRPVKGDATGTFPRSIRPIKPSDATKPLGEFEGV